MIKIHPQILKKNGHGEFVILSFKEFQAIQEMLEDADDILALRQAREEDDPSAPGHTLEEVRLLIGDVFDKDDFAAVFQRVGERATLPAPIELEGCDAA